MTTKPTAATMRLATFTIRELMLVTLAVCLGLGGYSLGSQRAERQWHLRGFAEAEDHYQVMLSSYAADQRVWDRIGYLWRDYPDMKIIGSPFDTEVEWQNYVQYHAQRNGWKDAAVFREIDASEREYAATMRDKSCQSSGK